MSGNNHDRLFGELRLEECDDDLLAGLAAEEAERVQLARARRDELARELLRRGRSLRWVARSIRLSVHAVERIRDRRSAG